MSVKDRPELSSNPEQFAMTRYQLALLPVLAGAILVLAGALNQKSAPAKPIVVVDGSQVSDPQAMVVLDQALAALAPERVRWLQCKVWQQGMCEDFRYQGCGRVLLAPGQRSRFDLNVQVGKTVGELRLVSNGKVLVQSIRLGGDKAVVTRMDLPPDVPDPALAPKTAALREQFLEANGGNSLSALLGGLRQCLRGAQRRQYSWSGHDAVVIAGALPEESNVDVPGIGLVPPRFQVRQAVLFLDGKTLWPHRVEWWGSEQANQPLQLLLQTEFRDPVLNQPMTPERCAAEFAALAG
jgi:hypothetical protein